MNTNTNFPKVQHFIPRFLLKNFSTEKKKPKILFINKHFNEGSISTNIKNVAGINRFYNYEGKLGSLENDFFGEIDNNASRVIQRLLSINNISELEIGSFEIAAKFIAAQVCRVPYVLETFKSIEYSLKEEISSEYPFFDGNVKDYFLDFVVNNTNAYTNILLNKKMTVFKSKTKKFIIGDNPVVILGGDSPSLKMSLSTCAIDGAVFMMPISPADVLVFYEENYPKNLKEEVENNNNWQFVKANEYVFGTDSEILENELKIYHGNAYRYIAQFEPPLIGQQNLVEGKPVSVGMPRFSFEGQAKIALRNFVSEKLLEMEKQ